MSARRSLLVVGCGLMLGLACLDFDLEGTVCNEDGTCPEGLVCSADNHCVDPTPDDRDAGTDAGTDAGVDAGPDPVCSEGQVQACGSGVGECAQTQTCQANGTWGPCDGASPVAEQCDLKDNDCDGDTDEDLSGAPLRGSLCELQAGVCNGAQRVCLNGAFEPVCTAASYGLGYEPLERSCDTADNDCDGRLNQSRTVTLVERPAEAIQLHALEGGGFGGVYRVEATNELYWRGYTDVLDAGTAEVLLNYGGPGAPLVPASAAKGTETLVAWMFLPESGGRALHGARISSDGTVFEHSPGSAFGATNEVTIAPDGQRDGYATAFIYPNVAGGTLYLADSTPVGQPLLSSDATYVGLSPADGGYGIAYKHPTSKLLEIETRSAQLDGGVTQLASFSYASLLSAQPTRLRDGPAGPELGFWDETGGGINGFVLKPGGAAHKLGPASNGVFDFSPSQHGTFGVFLQDDNSLYAAWALSQTQVTPIFLAGNAKSVWLTRVTDELVVVSYGDQNNDKVKAFYYCPDLGQRP